MSDKKSKQRGLGRGLSALMADVDVTTGANPDVEGVKSDSVVPVEQLVPNPDQPRRTFVEGDLDDLAASIAKKGIIQPLIVRAQDGGKYQIVAGERRWRAAQIAKLHSVPVIVRDYNDTEVLEIAIIENIQRSDLNAVEEALGYRQLMDRFGHTQEKMAEALGKSRSHIANLLRLLQLPEDVQIMLKEGLISAGHARALITSDKASELAKVVVARGLSVRQTEQLVKQSSKPAEVKTRTIPEKDADTKALEGDLSANLGMKVVVDHKIGTEVGQLTIKYKSLEDLDELCRMLSR